MALQFRTVPVIFEKGLNTRRDEKSGIPGDLLELENAVFTRVGRLQKRNGYRKLSTVIEGGGGYITAAEGIAVHGDEILLFTGTQAYSWMEASQTWVARGACYAILPENTTVLRNQYAQKNPDIAICGDLRVVVWEEAVQAGAAARAGIRYSVQDTTTGAFYVNDAPVSAYQAGVHDPKRPKCVTLDGQVFIFYADGANLLYRIIRRGTPGALGAEVNPISTLTPASNHYDVCVVPGVATTGEGRIYINANITDGASTCQLLYLERALGGAYDLTTIGTWVAVTQSNCVGIWSDWAQNVWVAGADNSSDVNVGCFSISGGVVTGAATVESGVETVRNICGFVPNLSTTATVYYETGALLDAFGNANPAWKRRIRTNTLTRAGVAGTASEFARGVGIIGKPFTTGTTTLLPVAQEWPLQSTAFLLDMAGKVAAKALPTEHGGLRTNATISESPMSASAANVAMLRRGRLVSASGAVWAPNGVAATAFRFDHADRFSSVTYANSLLVGGGLIWAYDGAYVAELGFNQFPEDVILANAAPAFALSVTAAGAVGVAQVVDVTVPDAKYIRSGQYFTIGVPSGPYYVWFNVDGMGSDPALGGSFVGIKVAVNSTDLTGTVATKLEAAFEAVAAEFTASTVGSVVTVTNVNTGVCHASATPPSNASAPNGVETGSIAFGGGETYFYAVIYEWVDNHGQVHRSAPWLSTETTPVAARVGLVIPSLKLTSKTTPVRAVVYRTTNGGATFARVSPLPAPTINNATVDTIHYVDVAADADLASNEDIYTNDGTLEAIAPQSAQALCVYRGRVFASGLADSNQIAYSLLAFTGDAPAWTDAFTITLDPTDGPVTALAVMDDKLVVFKRQAIYVIQGSGPTNAGEQDDFGTPAKIASDIGAARQSSVVLTPLGLMFQTASGAIYLLDRGLSVSYIGAPIERLNDGTAYTSAARASSAREVRFTTAAGTTAVMNYELGLWGTFTHQPAVASSIWQEHFIYARADGTVWVEEPGTFTDGGAFVKMRVTTSWMPFAGVQGFQRCQKVMLLGDYKGAHKLRVRIGTDYQESYTQEAWFDATTIIGSSTFGSVSPFGSEATFGGPWVNEQFQVRLERQKCQAVRVSIEDVQASGYNEGYSLSGLNLLVGVKRGQAKLPTDRRA